MRRLQLRSFPLATAGVATAAVVLGSANCTPSIRSVVLSSIIARIVAMNLATSCADSLGCDGMTPHRRHVYGVERAWQPTMKSAGHEWATALAGLVSPIYSSPQAHRQTWFLYDLNPAVGSAGLFEAGQLDLARFLELVVVRAGDPEERISARLGQPEKFWARGSRGFFDVGRCPWHNAGI